MTRYHYNDFHAFVFRGEIPEMNNILDRDDFSIMKRAIYATQVPGLGWLAPLSPFLCSNSTSYSSSNPAHFSSDSSSLLLNLVAWLYWIAAIVSQSRKKQLIYHKIDERCAVGHARTNARTHEGRQADRQTGRQTSLHVILFCLISHCCRGERFS